MSTNSDDYRAISFWPDADQRIVFTVRRTPETDAMTDEQLIAEHGPTFEALANEHRQDTRHDEPMNLSFSAFMKMTKPGPQEPCPTCHCWGLRRYSEPATPDVEKVICTNPQCTASPFHRD